MSSFQSYILIIYNKWCTVPTMLVRGYLKNINTGAKQKASHSKNDLLNGGGGGGIFSGLR